MGKSGSAKTLTALAVRDTLMKCVTIEFSYIKVYPALLGWSPFVLFGENCMSADQMNAKRGRRPEPRRAETDLP